MLDLPSEAGSRGHAGDVLERLRDAEFVPSPSWRQAMQTLVGSAGAPSGGMPSPHAPDALLSHGEEQARGEVEAFAAQFFQLQPGPRRERWQQLRSSPGLTPALTLRLDALAEGLDLDEKSLRADSPEVGELAELAARCSVLRPGARAQLRRQRLTEMSADVPRWQRAAARFERDRPALAALAPDLVRGLKGNTAAEKRPAVPLFASNAGGGASASAPVSSSSGSKWWIGIVILLALGGVRAMNSMNSSSKSSPYSPPPTYLKPPYLKPPGGDELFPGSKPLFPPGGGKSQESIEELLRKLRENGQRRKERGATSPSPSAPRSPSTEQRPRDLQPGEAFRRLFEDAEEQRTPSSKFPPSFTPGVPPTRPQ